ncbi:MAG: plasmid pRiA4b ORF-3 family protein [Actinomycetota bacterium]|nr:plasmid pRiA4b ORF-3 family protein [Actinomycetota bacterium]
MNDRDVRRILAALARLGAVTYSEDSAELTALGRYAIGRSRGEPEPGDPVLRVTITLAEVEPRVRRQLLIPAPMPLDRLHQVIQTAMGWENYHLHSFTDGKRTYGQPDPDLDFVDERTVQLGDLKVDRLYYTYDFGDGWEHEILLDPAGMADPDLRYPRCISGEGACPPEDCGGSGGYQHLREVLADADDAEHEAMVMWLGLEKAAEFDVAAFDLERVNRRLTAVDRPR